MPPATPTKMLQTAPPDDWVARMRTLRDAAAAARRQQLDAAKAAVPSRVRTFRAARGWSQAQLALVLGVHLNAVRTWETARNSPPPIMLELALRYLEAHPEISP